MSQLVLARSKKLTNRDPKNDSDYEEKSEKTTLYINPTKKLKKSEAQKAKEVLERKKQAFKLTLAEDVIIGKINNIRETTKKAMDLTGQKYVEPDLVSAYERRQALNDLVDKEAESWWIGLDEFLNNKQKI